MTDDTSSADIVEGMMQLREIFDPVMETGLGIRQRMIEEGWEAADASRVGATFVEEAMHLMFSSASAVQK